MKEGAGLKKFSVGVGVILKKYKRGGIPLKFYERGWGSKKFSIGVGVILKK